MHHILSALSTLIDILFPKTCVSCQATWSYLCSMCAKKALVPHSEICPWCHQASPDYRTCVWCAKDSPLRWLLINFQYTDPVQQLVFLLKYTHAYDLAPIMATKIALHLLSHPLLQRNISLDTAAIGFVPSHRYKKYWIKWYNQSELLAKEVAKIIWLPLVDISKRSRYTRSQVSLSRAKRKTNLIWAFACKEDLLPADISTLIIVDDITTTWSTLYQLTKKIQQTYPDLDLWWAVFARHGI